MRATEAIRLALQNTQVDRVLELLECFPDLSLEGHGLLATACCQRDLPFSVLDLLLSCGASPNEMDEDGWTPMRAAVRWSRPDLVAFLLDRGADANFQDSTGSTALHMLLNRLGGREGSTQAESNDASVCFKQDVEIANLLVFRAGANVYLRDMVDKQSVLERARELSLRFPTLTASIRVAARANQLLALRTAQEVIKSSRSSPLRRFPKDLCRLLAHTWQFDPFDDISSSGEEEGEEDVPNL